MNAIKQAQATPAVTRRQALIGAAAVGVVAVAGAGYYVWGRAAATPARGADGKVSMAELMLPGPLGDQAIGDPNAPVTVVEYASMTCPHCAHFHETTYPEMKKKYIDTGKVRFVFREFPLDPLAAAGSDVVLNGLGVAAEIAKTREAISADFAVKVSYSPADMTRPDAIAGMITKTIDEHGRLDVLVNNAGIQHVAPLQEFPVAKWDAILAINLSSAFHTTRLALPSMIANRWGRIINIASEHGLVGSAYKSAYVAAKHGILGLTKVTALEVAEQGITCNAICPGYVYTPLVEAQIEGQAKSHGIPREQVIRDVLLAQQPNKRFATVDELGAFSVFLASDAASSITGTSIAVDGGWTAH